MTARSLRKVRIIVGTLSVFSMVSMLLTLPTLVGAQPSANPPAGNVDASFNSVTISDGANDTLQVSSNGEITNPSGAVQINDANGTVINGTPGIAPVLTVTGNGSHNARLHSDGWITGTGGFHLGGDGTYANSNFVIYPGGEITDNNGAVTIWDGDGMDVRGDITDNGGQLQLNDDAEGIRLDSDTVINNDLTAYHDVTAWNSVNGSRLDITYHGQIRRIGNYKLAKILWKTMAPYAATNFNANLSSNILECPQNSIAVACNFEVYNGTAGCGNGSPTGGLNYNAAYPTRISMDPLWSHSSGTGGICSMTLYNKTSSWKCGRVEVVCWDPDGDY